MTRPQEPLNIESADRLLTAAANQSKATGTGDTGFHSGHAQARRGLFEAGAQNAAGNPTAISRLMAGGMRLMRYAILERSYERYYSPEEWERTYSGGYRLDIGEQDGRYGALLALLNRYDRGGPILDAGCGEGILESRYRVLSSTRIVGIDYSERAIERARARRLPGCEFYRADFRGFTSKEKFTTVVLNESLYYIEDFLGAVDTLSRHLSPEGVILISMFETLVTRRIWKELLSRYDRLQGVAVCDEGSRRLWRVRVLEPARKVG